MTDQEEKYGDRLEDCYSGAVYDVLWEMGYSSCVLPPSLSPLQIDQKLGGKIFTVSGRVDPDLDDHETLLEWTGFLSEAPSGSVVVCQPNDPEEMPMSYMGELSAETLQLRGVRGYVVEGGCRDTELITDLGFPVFCEYCTPQDIKGSWVADELGEPIRIGRVQVEPGDYVMADRDGVVVIPEEVLEETVEKTEQVIRTESKVRKAIRGGADPQEAYLEHGTF